MKQKTKPTKKIDFDKSDKKKILNFRKKVHIRTCHARKQNRHFFSSSIKLQISSFHNVCVLFFFLNVATTILYFCDK